MKKITIKNLMFLSVAGVLLALSACKKDFDKINTSPNSPTSVPNSYLLTGAEKGLMDNTWDRWWNGTTGMLLAQYYAENQYTDESQYQFRNTTIKDYWNEFYAGGIPDQFSQSTTTFPEGGLKELQTVIDNCKSDTAKYAVSGYYKNQIAVATILEVWVYQNMTDTWGDIPFSQALQDVKNTQPKYDKQSDIYPALLAKLDTALSLIDVSKSDLIGDLIYSGNMASWAKFGNSLKMRVAIRMADRNSALAGTKIAEAVTAGVFTSNADNALFPYTNGSPNYNPLYYDRNVTGRQDFSSANTIVDVMNALNDTRIGIYFNSPGNAPGTYVGRPYGQSSSNAGNTAIGDVSQQGDATIAATAPGVYLDYAQVEFMLAEAVERGYTVGGTAAGHYAAGIDASFNFWTGAASPAGYLTQATVDYATLKGAGQTWKQIIGKQKWLALYMQGIQGWIEWRRLDFGILQATADPQLQGTGVPVRMTYPYSEQSLNPKAYNDAITNQGPDQLTTKVWWDVN